PVTITHDGSGNLSAITDVDTSGRSFQYDSGHRLTQDTWGPLLATFTYDATTGRLSGVNRGGGTVYTIHPQQSQSLASNPAIALGSYVATVADPLSHTTSFTLDLTGRLVQEQDANGAVTQWLRNGTGQVVVYQPPQGCPTVYHYDPTSGDLLNTYYPD